MGISDMASSLSRAERARRGKQSMTEQEFIILAGCKKPVEVNLDDPVKPDKENDYMIQLKLRIRQSERIWHFYKWQLEQMWKNLNPGENHES